MENAYLFKHDRGVTSFLASAIISHSGRVDRSLSPHRYRLSMLPRYRLSDRFTSAQLRPRGRLSRFFDHMHQERDMQDVLAFSVNTTYIYISYLITFHLLCRPRYNHITLGFLLATNCLHIPQSPVARWAALCILFISQRACRVGRHSRSCILSVDIVCIYPWWIDWIRRSIEGACAIWFWGRDGGLCIGIRCVYDTLSTMNEWADAGLSHNQSAHLSCCIQQGTSHLGLILVSFILRAAVCLHPGGAQDPE